jgi:nucleotide-binding universal stress UspA family protein
LIGRKSPRRDWIEHARMYEKILVPLDGSEAANRGLHEAIGLARGRPARLHLLHVVEDLPLADIPPSAEFDAALESLRRRGEDLLAKASRTAIDQGAQADTLVIDATGRRAADVIVDTARERGCDLIVIGTHGRRGLSRLMMGSDAERVARTAPVPVLLVRQPQTESR